MSAEVHDFPSRVLKTTGGGPEDPMIEQRVANLEATVGDIRTSGARIEAKLERHEEALRRIEDALKVLVDVREKVAHIDGRLANIPTFWQTLALMATLLIGLSGIIFSASRFLHP
jgi:hypothetical protein